MKGITQTAKIHIGPRTRVALAEAIAELQAQRKKTHDPYRRDELDAKIKALLALLVAFAFACPFAFMPLPAQARDPAPCGPYMAATGCIIALQNSAKQCVEKLHVATPSAAQTLACVRQSLAENGATDALSGPFEPEPEQPGY